MVGHPRRNLAGLGAFQVDDRLKRREQVGVAGEQDANIELVFDGSTDEVDGYLHVDPLLDRTRTVSVVQRSSDSSHQRLAAPEAHLPLTCAEALRVMSAGWHPAIDVDCDEIPLADAHVSQHQAETQRQDLTVDVVVAVVPEALPGALVDVLVVDENRHPACHTRRVWQRN